MYGGENHLKASRAKCVNVSLKVLSLFDFGHVWIFHSLSSCSLCLKCQKSKFFILHVFMGKKPIWLTWWNWGYGCINGFIAQKWLISAEGSILRKCRQLLGLILELVIGCYGNICCCFFAGWKSKCDFLVFLIKMCCMLQSKIVQSIKFFILVKVEGIGCR